MSTTTNPSTISISVTDQFVQGVDLAPALPPGGTASTPVVTLTDTTSGQRVSLPTPTLTGSVVSVLLTGADMHAGHVYTLRVVFNGGSDAPALTTTTTVTVTA